MKKILRIPFWAIFIVFVLTFWLLALMLWPLVTFCEWCTKQLEVLTVRLLRRHYRRTRPPHLGDAYPDPDQ